MITKLTLTIEQELIRKAKEYAKQKNRSLSDIIENYLKIITQEEKKEPLTYLTPITKSLKGSFKMPEDFDYKKELANRREQKYL